MPVGDLGLPVGYKSTKSAIIAGIQDRKELQYESREKKWDFCLIKRNNTSAEMYENNIFENYFGDQTVKRIENLLKQESRPQTAVT